MRKMAFASLASVVVIGGGVYIDAIWPLPDDVQQTMVDMGYLPIVPPIGGMRVGSLYFVDLSGHDVQLVCSAPDDMIKPVLISLPTGSGEKTKLRQASLNVSSKILSAINEEFGSHVIESVDYELTDAHIDQIAWDALGPILDKMMTNPYCDNEVKTNVGRMGLICQLQSAVLGTVHYSMKRDSNAKVSGDLKEAAKRIDLGGDVDTSIIGKSDWNGDALYYGMRFKPECVTRRFDGRLTLPNNFLDRVMLQIRLVMS